MKRFLLLMLFWSVAIARSEGGTNTAVRSGADVTFRQELISLPWYSSVLPGEAVVGANHKYYDLVGWRHTGPRTLQGVWRICRCSAWRLQGR